MKLTDAKHIIKEIYKTDSVTALISERGVGKTSIYKQSTEELGIGYIDLYAAALEGPDFMGLPNKNIDLGITTYFAPSFLPTIESIEKGIHPTAGIIVLEEINRVSPDTISVLYPLLLDRKLNGHILANGWKIGVTMNPDNMNYMVNTLDDAIIDRFISINIEPDVDEYIDYSLTKNYDPSVLDFLKSYPEMLLIVNKSSTVTQKSPTPRGWSKVQEVLSNCTIKGDLLQETLAGIVGAEAAASFLGFKNIKTTLLPSVNDLLTNFSIVEPTVLRLIESRRFDLLTNLIRLISVKIESDNLNSLDQLNMFLNVLPQELQVLFYRELSQKDESLLSEISGSLDSFDKLSDVIIDLMIS